MTRETMQVTVGVASDFVVKRYDPEYAEMDNPRGAIVGERFFLLAEAEDGSRWSFGGFETEAEAEEAYELTAPPVSEWGEDQPCYGSLAYRRMGCSAEYWDEDEIAGEHPGAMMALAGY
jgi:hypothetical protein